MDKHLVAVECIRSEKRGMKLHRHEVYVVIVEWSTGEKYPIYRKYSSFFDFERSLKDRYGSMAEIPVLPAKNAFEKAFKKQKNHIADINEFCQAILKLRNDLVNSSTVSAFFDVWPTDFSIDESVEEMKPVVTRRRDAKKKVNNRSLSHSSSIDKYMDDNSQSAVANDYLDELPSHPPPSIDPDNQQKMMSNEDELPLYVCSCSYQPDSKDELSLETGQKFHILEQNEDGWWFVIRESDGKQGYAPGSFFSPQLPERNYNSSKDTEPGQTNPDFTALPIMSVTAVSDYTAKNNDEISYTEGEKLDVLQTNHTGWWLVRCESRIGLVPAVHLQLEPGSADSSKVILRNNSLYARRPPPRGSSTKQVIKDTGYASIEELRAELACVEDHHSNFNTSSTAIPASLDTDIQMATQKVPHPCNNKAKPTSGQINYVTLVFDNEAEKAKSQSQAKTKEEPEKVIYTQIIPKNMRQVNRKGSDATQIEVPTESKESETQPPLPLPPQPQTQPQHANKANKPVKKLFKGIFGKRTSDSADRQTPSPPPSIDKESPLVTKNGTVSQSQQQQNSTQNHLYENHDVVNAATQPAPCHKTETQHQPHHTYINIKTLSSTNGVDQGQQDVDRKSPLIFMRRKDQKLSVPPNYYLRRSSVEPPPAPSTEAPYPSGVKKTSYEDDGLSPMISRVQAIATYDGPNISGMLMFTRGDVATLMMKSNHTGWWFVNLGGIEGYVPGGYWDRYQETSSNPSSISPPLSRRKPPQPMPRSRSPPNANNNTQISMDKSDREDEAWYHGRMSRPESEKILQPQDNGVYLIRESVNRVGYLTLSVKWESKVRHFPIEAKDGGLYYIGKHDFKTLQGVIDHYSRHALFYSECNEAVKLKSAARKA